MNLGAGAQRWLMAAVIGFLLGAAALCGLLVYTLIQPGTSPSGPNLPPDPAANTRPPSKTPERSNRPLVFLPQEAWVDGVVGHDQIATLDCEARSAVDWAAFFGVTIDEMDFIDTLPYTNNPETGFVGTYTDPRGQLPPDSYGVHAPPVAEVLRRYKLSAFAWKDLTWWDVQYEIANGRPVIAWVVGSVSADAQPETYTPPGGEAVTVARFEHTVIVTGYNTHSVTVVDGSQVYDRDIDTFLASWGVLHNMAITASDLAQ